MSLSLLSLIALFPATLTLASSTPSLANYTQAFTQAQIIPDVLASFNPTAFLDVIYTDPSTKASIHVPPGSNLTVQQVANEPSFLLTSNDSSIQNESFVVTMVDPDAPTPSNRSLGEIRHLVAGDFVLNKNTSQPSQLTNQSAAISNYISPGPPPNSPPHRYVILVYVQPPNFAETVSTLLNASSPPTNFNLTTFSNAVKFGNPIAGTFFLTGPSSNSSTTSSTSAKAVASTPSGGAIMGRQVGWSMTGVLGLTMAAVLMM